MIETRETKDTRNKIRDRDKNSAEGVVTQFVNWLRLDSTVGGTGSILVREDLHYMVGQNNNNNDNKLVGSLKKKKDISKGHCVSALVTVLLILAPEITSIGEGGIQVGWGG